MYLELPNPQIPPIKIFKPDIRKQIAEDDRLKLSLTKSVDNIKNDEYIMHSVADSIVLGVQDIPIPWGSWIVYVGLATTAIVGVLVLLSCYLFLRVRSLVAAVTMLQQVTIRMAEAAEEVQQRLNLTIVTTTQPPMFSDWPDRIREFFPTNWMNIVLVLLLLLVGLVLFKLFYDNYIQSSRLVLIETTLVLQFVSLTDKMNVKNVALKWQTFPAIDLILVSHNPPKQLKLTGGIWPNLTCIWEASVQQLDGKRDYPIIQEIPLRYIEKRELHELLNGKVHGRDYEIHMYFIQNNKIYKPYMETESSWDK